MGDVTCIICCSSHPADFVFGGHQHPPTKSSDKPHIIFRNFCTDLLSIKRLELERGLAVCSNCIENIAIVLDSKNKVDEVEARVRKLQLSILSEMRGLQTQVEDLEGQLRKMEDKVKGSDESRLGVNVKANCGGGRNDALFFRKCLSDVTKDFRYFRTELRKKVSVDGASTTPQSSSLPSRKTRSQNRNAGSTDIEVQVKKEPNIPMELVQFEDLDVDLSLSLPYQEAEPEPEHSLLSPGGEDISDNFFPDQQVDDNFKRPCRPSLPPPKKGQYIKKRKYRPGYHADINISGMSPFKKYLIKNLISLVAPRLPPANHNPEDDNGDNSVVESFLRDVRLDRTLSPIEYIEDKGIFVYKGVEFLINEDAKTLKCSQCPLIIKPKWNHKQKAKQSTHELKRKVKCHVMGRHLDTLQCPLCDKKYSFYKAFCGHLKCHLEPCNCHICGRPLASGKNVEQHIWTHKNDEEKAEAVQEGTCPRNYYRKIASTSEDIQFQCSTCGKNFNTRIGLIMHEKRHDSGANQEQILCTDCGKYIPKLKYRYHTENVCIPEGTPWVKCIHCERSFRTVAKMHIHLKRTHTTEAIERPHQCDVCQPSRNFKSLAELKVHMKIHSVVRPFQCSKGCGKDFAVKRNLKRHEPTCKGVWRRPRGSGITKKQQFCDEEPADSGDADSM